MTIHTTPSSSVQHCAAFGNSFGSSLVLLYNARQTSQSGSCRWIMNKRVARLVLFLLDTMLAWIFLVAIITMPPATAAAVLRPHLPWQLVAAVQQAERRHAYLVHVLHVARDVRLEREPRVANRTCEFVLGRRHTATRWLTRRWRRWTLHWQPLQSDVGQWRRRYWLTYWILRLLLY